MPKKKRTNEPKKYIFAGGLIFIVIFAVIFSFILIDKRNNDLSFFYAKDSTKLNKYHLTKENKEFIKNTSIDENFYGDLNTIYTIKDNEFIVYLYSESCDDNCINNEVIDYLRELKEKGNTIYSIDYNRISNVDYAILTNSNSSLSNLSFLYVKQGRIVDIIQVFNDDYSSIPTKEKNSYDFIIGLEESTDKRSYLTEYYEKNSPDITEEEINEIVDSYMQNFETN